MARRAVAERPPQHFLARGGLTLKMPQSLSDRHRGDFQARRSDPRQSTLGKIEAAFPRAGIELFDEADARREVRSE
jgi:hypothetical protein